MKICFQYFVVTLSRIVFLNAEISSDANLVDSWMIFRRDVLTEKGPIFDRIL